MKKWINGGATFIALVSTHVQADIIVSGVVKSSERQTVSSTSVTTTNTYPNNKKRPSDTSSSSTSSQDNARYNAYGALFQFAPSAVPVVFGAGYFDDATGLVTVGWRFQ